MVTEQTTFSEYLKAREPVLGPIIKITDQLREDFFSLGEKLSQEETVSKNIEYIKVYEGMGRPYEIQRATISNQEEGITVVIDTYVVGNYRRSNFWFTDPILSLNVFNEKGTKISLKIMGNSEVELKFTLDGVNFIEIRSYNINNPEELENLLRDPRVLQVLKTFGFRSLFEEEAIDQQESANPLDFWFNRLKIKILELRGLLPQELLLSLESLSVDQFKTWFENLNSSEQQAVLQAIYDNRQQFYELGMMVVLADLPEKNRKLVSVSRPVPDEQGVQEPTNWGETFVLVTNINTNKQNLGMWRTNISGKRTLIILNPDGKEIKKIYEENLSNSEYKVK
ncbi:MAG: hypothetical protein QHH09_01030 [Microgenomates group bacterium]|nr:hypothetical protein [Microgenomates group bacterium]